MGKTGISILLDITICYYCCRTGTLNGARFVQGFSVAHGHTAQAKIDLTCMTRVVGAEQSVCRCGPERETSVFLYTGPGTRLLGQCDCHWSADAGVVALGSCQGFLGLGSRIRRDVCCCLGFVVIALLRPRAAVREVFALFA